MQAGWLYICYWCGDIEDGKSTVETVQTILKKKNWSILVHAYKVQIIASELGCSTFQII